MQDFRQLLVWQKAHDLALAVYRATASFPSHELYGITSQMRRAAVSIPTNIAEGCGRDSRLEFIHFLQIAAGSAAELEYLVLIARDLGLLNPGESSDLSEKTIEIKRMLTGLIKQVRSKLVKSHPDRNNEQFLKTDD